MDMGEILSQWDELKARNARQQNESRKVQGPGKKANAPEKKSAAQKSAVSIEDGIHEENSRQINPMEMWLRRYGTIDKDKIAQESEERTKMRSHSYLVNMKSEAVLDLHGLHQDEVDQRLDAFVTDCCRRKIKKILIIHGKGIHTTGGAPVLGKMVRDFIERDKRCGMSGHPKKQNQEGGSGATWVILKG